MIDTVRWKEVGSKGSLIPGKLRMIDQTKLPNELAYLETDKADVIYDAIRRLVVRGAPAIGCAAALGLGAVCQHSKAQNREAFLAELKTTADYFAKSRPTAVNLFWALNRCVRRLCESTETEIEVLKLTLIKEGIEILEEDIQMCRAIGEHGLSLIKDNFGILTHCNAGALATGDFGTALSPIYLAHERGLKVRVFSDETRPLLQGSRLTAWELERAGIDVTTICDNMAAQVMKEKKIDLVITGADRIAVNGDSANKIGTYGVAILAKYHRIPFYIAAPSSTIDMNTEYGDAIPIEQRDGDEIRMINGKFSAPVRVKTYNPAFDVVPNELITGIITEKGILRQPFATSIAKLFK